MKNCLVILLIAMIRVNWPQSPACFEILGAEVNFNCEKAYTCTDRIPNQCSVLESSSLA